MNLVRVGAITGVIRNEDGTPAISVRVMAVPPSSVDSIACDIRGRAQSDWRFNRDLDSPWNWSLHGAYSLREAMTDHRGRYRLYEVPATFPTESVQLIVDGHSRPSGQVRVNAGQTAIAPKIKFRGVREKTQLDGWVQDYDGLPVHGAEIALDGREFALSDEHGRFRFHDVRPKRSHILEVSAPGYASSRTKWKSEAGEPRIVLDRVQEVTFQVIDQADQPVGGASVEILDPDGRTNLPIRWPWRGGLSGEHLARTDVDGFVRLGLRPGRVFLEVSVDSSTETTCFELLSTPLPTTISRLRLP